MFLSRSKVRTAVIPAAGLGTRFLPATKVVPKELLPVHDKPLIQFAVEEAAASGLENVILIIGKGKNLLAEHFRRNISLEDSLLRQGKTDLAEQIRLLSTLARIHTVWQESPLGLADAIRSARPLVRDEAFAVILPDALIDSTVPCIRQLMECFEHHPGCIIATGVVDSSEVSRFGILDLTSLPDSCCDRRVSQVNALVERPASESVTSRNGIFGRYILEPEIFSCIERTAPGFAGELQLTDALMLRSSEAPLYAYQFEGKHYDAGSKLGLLKANLAYGLRDSESEAQIREYLATLEPMESAKPC